MGIYTVQEEQIDILIIIRYEVRDATDTQGLKSHHGPLLESGCLQWPDNKFWQNSDSQWANCIYEPTY